MSGGRPSRPQTVEGDHPSCTNAVRKDGETAGCARSASAGLGLDGGWGRRPLLKRNKVQPFRAGEKSNTRNGRGQLNEEKRTAILKKLEKRKRNHERIESRLHVRHYTTEIVHCPYCPEHLSQKVIWVFHDSISCGLQCADRYIHFGPL
jgi:hypothetical protein